MPGSSSGNGILIVDCHPLRGAAIAAVVKQLVGSQHGHIEPMTAADDVKDLIDGGATFQMIIYSIGCDSVGGFRHRKGIQKLGVKPVVVFSDNQSQTETVLALNQGVWGYIHSRMSVTATKRALSFMLRGGLYFSPLLVAPAR